MIITMDGPAGAGKSTTAKELAKKLKFNYFNSGALFRTCTIICVRNDITPKQEDKIAEVLSKAKIGIKYIDGIQHMYIGNEDVTDECYSVDISNMTPQYSKVASFHNFTTEYNRKVAKEGNFIFEGRGMGNYMFPNADLKFYLDCKPEERAKRRCLEWQAKGFDADEKIILKEIIERDNTDKTRAIANLCIPEDGYYIDTTTMSTLEVVEKMYQIIQAKVNGKVK